ncbi:hypothetical protein [Enterococcus termitis]|uniref:hypothetical protein n=1 Tax=Enterococcus termitis TaxID=332950 RepID=UPI001112D30F|nr:hypothetical protein [Enterococcus termitis]
MTKEDLKQLETDLRGLKEAYQKELEREQSERDIQATKDSEQSKILADEAVKEAEAEKLKIESEAKEKEASENFRLSVLESLEKLDKSEENTLTNDSITKLNKNIEVLIEYQKNQAQNNTNQDWFLSIIALSVVVFPAIYFAIKFCAGTAKKIISIITT